MPDDRPRNFIQQIIDEDNASGKWEGRVHTRFPPEPNGYLHVGHAAAICLNAGLAREFGGKFNLRFDDTNPAKEEAEYVEAIERDVKWLGADWEGRSSEGHGGGLFFASDYFEQMYAYAVELITKGKAYVCDLTAEQTREYRGTVKQPGKPSPFCDRTIKESLDLFARMKAGEFADGSRTLRAKIDMASPNMNLRDPVMYRVQHATHHRTGDAWSIYPMYDWAHGLEDSIEGITHSICTLEFEDHRPLYDWFIDAINEGRGGTALRAVSEEASETHGSESRATMWGPKIHHPQQIEFAKFILNHFCPLSKRNMIRLVKEGHVDGWDDPRMLTVSGLRKRGCTPEAIRNLCDEVGVTKFNAVRDVVLLENAIRTHLNKVAPRRMAVLRPIKVVIENYPEGQVEEFAVPNNPEDESAGMRKVAFSRELFIERDDFMEDPPRKFFRLGPGREVRLRGAYWIRCDSFSKNEAGEVVELRCTYDPETRGGGNPPPDAEGKVRKVKGTLHWVSAAHAIEAEVRLFDRLFTVEAPGKATGDFIDDLNPDSVEVLRQCKLEAALAAHTPDEPDWSDGIRRFQFERLGYFCVDDDAAQGGTALRAVSEGTEAHGSESCATSLVFNRTVTLRDSWAKMAGKK